jgi:hypothetical protein
MNYWQQMLAVKLLMILIVIRMMTLYAASYKVRRHIADTLISSLILSP